MSGITTRTEESIVVNTVDEETTLDDIAAHIARHVDSWAETSVLWDPTACDFHRVFGDDTRRLAKSCAPLASRRAGRRTAVVAPEDYVYGLVRAFEAHLDGPSVGMDIRAFRTVEGARAWLEE
jgi:hypothetical protein